MIIWRCLSYGFLGALSAVGWPPLHMWPVTWLAWIILLQTKNWRYHAAFLFCFMISGFHWIYFAFEAVGLQHYGALAVVCMALILASLRVLITFSLARYAAYTPLSLALGHAVGEWFQSHAFGGLPWHLLPYTWPYPECWQISAWCGVETLSLFMWVSFGLIATYYWRLIVLGWVLIFVFGHVRIPKESHALSYNDYTVRLVHPALKQSDKWQKGKFSDITGQLLMLSKQGEAADLVVWPEAAVPAWMSDDLAQWLWPYKIPLVTGCVRKEGDDIYTSLCVICEGKIHQTYNKRHLTPFGEYMPIKLPLGKLTHGAIDYKAGDEPVIFSVGGKRFWPIICFESIFGSEMRPPRSEHIDAAILVTNDGWFGPYVGPQQHAHIARFRAVEWGVPIIRVANAGISMMIDRYGRVVTKAGCAHPGALDALLH